MHDSATSQAAGAAEAPVVHLGQRERQVIFMEMVKAEMQAGLLRHSKRRQLLRYASKMGVAEFEAHLMIARVQHGAAHADALRPLSPAEVRRGFEDAQQSSRALRRLLIATGAAVVLHGALIGWVFYF